MRNDGPKKNKLYKSFGFAFEGIFNTIARERNMQIHCLATVLVVIFGFILDISLAEWFVCLILFALVMSLELVNTSIEAVVDLVTEEKKPLAKKAKDAAAQFPLKASTDDDISLDFDKKIPVLKKHLDFGGRIKTKTLGRDGFSIEHENVELRAVEQLIDAGQVSALCKALLILAGKYFNKKMSLDEMADDLLAKIEKDGPDALFAGAPYAAEGLTAIRRQELYACLNRCRFIDM